MSAKTNKTSKPKNKTIIAKTQLFFKGNTVPDIYLLNPRLLGFLVL